MYGLSIQCYLALPPLPIGGASALLIGTLRGPPPGSEGFATGFSFDKAFALLVVLAAGVEGCLTVLLGTGRIFCRTSPSPEEGLENTFCLLEILFSFSKTADGRTRSTVFVILPFVSGTKTRPRTGRAFLGWQTSCFFCKAFLVPESHPISSSDNTGEGAGLEATPKTAVSSESPSLESKTGDKGLLAAFGGVIGESDNFSIRLRGLGRAGEYACTILWAKGFATGKGRRIGAGVTGLEGEISSIGGESSPLSSMGRSSRAGGRTGPVGSDARGDGGGRTKGVGRRDNDGAKDDICGGINSVS